MQDLYTAIIQELTDRGSAYVDDMCPYYISSIGCHLLNLVNQSLQFYVESGRPIDTRLHILFVAPPGFSKSFWLSQFLRGAEGILTKSGIEVLMEATLSGAGFVGTVKFGGQNDAIREMGLAEQSATAIIGVEEFAAVTNMFKTTHSSDLDTALLQALDSGFVYKRLAAGSIKFRTYLTLWSGCQPARFDLSSGLGRRFLFIEFIPNKADFRILTEARRNSKGRRSNPVQLQIIRDGVRELVAFLRQLNEVTIDPKFYDLMDKHEIIHYEEVLYERLMLGLSVMRGHFVKSGGGYRLDATLDDLALKFLEDEIVHRQAIKRGSEYSQVFTILEDTETGKASIDFVREMLLNYGNDYTQASTLIFSMIKTGLVNKSGEIISLKKPVKKK